MLAFGFLWWVTRKATSGVPSRTQSFVELLLTFINDQVKGIYNGPSRMVAPIALTTFVLVTFLNAMDFLPVDIVSAGLQAVGFHEFRFVPNGPKLSETPILVQPVDCSGGTATPTASMFVNF